MKKLERRALMCLLLAGMLTAGLGFYIGKWLVYGSEWVSYPANKHVFTDGKINTGSIYDRNGQVLLENTESGEPEYSNSYSVRTATLHAVGDIDGNILTGANRAFAGKLVGYNPVTGTYSAGGEGRKIYLTIDADACVTANEALGDHKGAVMVYNYKTGDVLCMTSSPNYDPTDPPRIKENDTSGVYLNRCTTARIVPGSIFKLVTSAAVIEKKKDLESWTYNCTGKKQFESSEVDRITCPYPHGEVDFEEALAVSCNCGFADLTLSLGIDNIKEYTKKAGLMDSYNINGIHTTPGSFDFPSEDVNIAWTGIGQYHDLVNPCSMMIYAGAIAGGGKVAVPNLIDSIETNSGLPAGINWSRKTDTLIESETASVLSDMMRNNVIKTYGEYNFPDLDICAKSGTAEVGGGNAPNAWFTGFLRDEKNPYAFIVLVENGGSGANAAGSVANKVLQELVNE